MKTLAALISFSILGVLYIGSTFCQNHKSSCEERVIIENKIDVFEYLDETQEALEESLQGLSGEQMQFIIDENSWSAAQIIEHINIVEFSLKSLLESRVSENTSTMNEEVEMTDEEVVQFITDRSKKIPTQDQFKPSNKFKNADEAIEAFKDQREELVDWLKDSEVDMRSFVNEFPFGKIDGYQTLLFMAGHTARHTAQIEELKKDPNFPED
ncbi:DinB family protein [Christiangramia forsetii]|uniref:DinB-like domain-containing protein n=2 Tax=Christiangramia forsetii TaxID=411153 RepID=A0M1P6_CHRFK|nr:DinB family protein [Christiangramia forsetii]GGG41997.1 hypothetical protein GCM10011532_27260 [Christiangramia forsetii]CAL66541.1 conserved hypothetical protein [Christiangramia forsetii KT0803]